MVKTAFFGVGGLVAGVVLDTLMGSTRDTLNVTAGILIGNVKFIDLLFYLQGAS